MSTKRDWVVCSGGALVFVGLALMSISVLPAFIVYMAGWLMMLTGMFVGWPTTRSR